MGFGGMGPGMMGWGSSGQAMCSAMAGHIEGRLVFIKAELKITQDQESLWSAYATAARDDASSMLAHAGARASEFTAAVNYALLRISEIGENADGTRTCACLSLMRRLDEQAHWLRCLQWFSLYRDVTVW